MMKSIARPWVYSSCPKISRKYLVPDTKVRTLISQQQRASYSTKPLEQDGRPFRMAVIGSGPAGFYTAYKVMSKIENSVVDMYEHLPVPFGLVRFGVSPDHPEVKNCQEKFTEVASSPRFNFIGNIAIGALHQPNTIPLCSILPHYDAVLFSYGASRDKSLGIPGEDSLSGIYSARAFVGWYNGLPEYADLKPDLSGEEAVVVGQGNVALDVARILVQDVEVLKGTDITEEALDVLGRSKVKRVRVVGRRGPLQAAFTIKEVREQMKLSTASFLPYDTSLIPPDLKALPRPSRRLMEVIQKGSTLSPSEAPKSWSLDFCFSPTSFNASVADPSRLGSISFERTKLVPDAFDPSAKAVGTGEHVKFGADVAFRSIGYKSEALPGFAELGIPFDQRAGIIPNDYLGRVVHQSNDMSPSGDVVTMPGMYCSGWVKRGPTGVIASTMNDAFSTADSIVEDWSAKKAFLNEGKATGLGWEGIKDEAEKRGCRRVSWNDWNRIDAVEKSNGQKKGKEREKITRIEDMLAVLD